MEFRGGHRVRLLGGGDELFPAMAQALARARTEAWMATYIFNDDQAGRSVADALCAAAARGVQVRVLVDGFGSVSRLPVLRRWFEGTGVQLEVFRPLDRWWAWLQPGQLRRMHHKLLAVDAEVAYVGGINVIDDRYDIHHGWSERARLDFAVELEGAVAGEVARLAQALWTRASLARGWREELGLLVRSPEPVARTAQLWRELRTRSRAPREDREAAGWERLPPVRAALVVRDNFRQRRAIERSYVEAIRRARERIDIACPYFYPGHAFRRALRRAAARGVRVRLLMQGMIDYRIAALAARVLYDEMLAHGIQVYEYTPAFLHAKVALVDRRWATVGSSNIDPLSLLLNLEANVVLLDEPFTESLAQRLERAFGESTPVTTPALRPGLRGWAVRGFVAWLANTYLRLAGAAGRY
ncbi:MAG: cardiolipin synthase ClsB [Rubrivivax sp.]